MFKNRLGEDSPIPKLIHLKIRRRDGVESLTTLEEGEFMVLTDGCINSPLILKSLPMIVITLLTTYEPQLTYGSNE